jgi:hypothetical protein
MATQSEVRRIVDELLAMPSRAEPGTNPPIAGRGPTVAWPVATAHPNPIELARRAGSQGRLNDQALSQEKAPLTPQELDLFEEEFKRQAAAEVANIVGKFMVRVDSAIRDPQEAAQFKSAIADMVASILQGQQQ